MFKKILYLGTNATALTTYACIIGDNKNLSSSSKLLRKIKIEEIVIWIIPAEWLPLEHTRSGTFRRITSDCQFHCRCQGDKKNLHSKTIKHKAQCLRTDILTDIMRNRWRFIKFAKFVDGTNHFFSG